MYIYIIYETLIIVISYMQWRTQGESGVSIDTP